MVSSNGASLRAYLLHLCINYKHDNYRIPGQFKTLALILCGQVFYNCTGVMLSAFL